MSSGCNFTPHPTPPPIHKLLISFSRNSWWLVAGSLCLLPLHNLWIWEGWYRSSLYCWLWIFHAVRDNCRILGRQTVCALYLDVVCSSFYFWYVTSHTHFFRGRKRACVTYCISYILSCITKHSPQYKILMVGRILGGIATSLLFSSFESWLVAEHNKVLKLFYYDLKGVNCLGVLLRSLPTTSTHSSINY